MSERRPSTQENYELQEDFLAQEQLRIGTQLFEKGVISKIVGDALTGGGARLDVQGLAQFTLLFTPSMKKFCDEGRSHEQLSLTAIKSEENSRTFSYFPLGTVDNYGILYPYPGVDYEAAQVVAEQAMSLRQAKTDGLLPNLDYSLLLVNNPNTGIMLMPSGE